MTIAERRAREERDRRNPWKSVAELPADIEGAVCEVRVSLHGIATDLTPAKFIYEGGRWYRIDPAQRVHDVVEWRKTGAMLSEGRRELVVLRADGSYLERRDDGKVNHLEYRGGRLYSKPKSYKSYWRAEDEDT